jgi:hypothetical protein
MILQGRNIILLAGGKAIAAAKSCDLEISADAIPVASPSDGAWEDAIPGRKSWKTSCSHLVTGIVDSAAMVGTVVTLRMQVRGKMGLPFDGFLNNPTLEEETLTEEPTAIKWDLTRHRFIAEFDFDPFGTTYYGVWPNSRVYAFPSLGSLFYDDSNQKNVYKKGTTDLEIEALQGSAIVRDWKVVGTLGNLAQGSFRFQGKGALTNPTT